MSHRLPRQVVLETGLAPDRASRPNGIDTVVKYQIRIHNNMSSSDVDVQAQNSTEFSRKKNMPKCQVFFCALKNLVGKKKIGGSL